MNVLITRPDERGQQLVKMLEDKGIFALHQPLFRLEAGRELPQLPSALARLNVGDYLFAVSKNAVDFAHQILKQIGFHWRPDLHYFAVGQRSANYFSALSEQAVHYPFTAENSEGLLALPEMQDLSDKNVLILRANTGREYFAEQATLRGAKVHTLECYQRVPIQENMAEQLSLFKRIGVDTIVITSSEILTELFEKTQPEERDWLVHTKLIVVGMRIARLAKKLGWQYDNIQISSKADNHSLLEIIVGNLN